MKKQKILLIFGTRPEAIKMAPLYWKLKDSNLFIVESCVTGQHREMLDQVLEFFKIKPDYDLNIMKNNQSLFEITARVLIDLENVLEHSKPNLVIVQGDTTSAFVGALASYYKKIKIAHLEAGLRSKNKYAPYPEEINRVLISHLADYHFTPTELAKENLRNEGIKENVWVVGNTVIDALFLGLDIINKDKNIESEIKSFFEEVISYNDKDRIILVTGHRRENFGKGFENICNALKEIAGTYKEFKIVYPVHLNPNVRKPVFDILKELENVYLIEPLPYHLLIWLMSKSYLVLTDSGGIQEEAPSLGKPLLVMREVTERIEGIINGTADLVGTDKQKIVNGVRELIENKNKYQRMAKATNPYGDGKSSDRILEILKEILDENHRAKTQSASK
ncbi:MAG: UDP-N-acetylglucosamine 2-epimerase (non-hydrolyzing) [Thermodesulfovibrio sp.]|nr:UDP-N-acetylglucosamine 2-epimerase (non-hydrolyzing) [Thermodesulfovibrio sp.]